jgi:cobyrinic acid a,c-diamide synthase
MKGCVISAAMTGAGKTTVTLGLLGALKKRGMAVQPFKVGPDFIDTGLHEIASGVPSHNLDGWMLNPETNGRLFQEACAGKDAALVEGVMGLYDGYDGKSERGSTAEMAKWLRLPVILVVDAQGMARSAAALIQGFRTFDRNVKIAGVIFNRVGSEGHRRILVDAVKGIPVLGWLPVNPSIEIPERHLGLLTAREVTAAKVGELGAFVERYVNVDGVLALTGIKISTQKSRKTQRHKRKRVALAHDRAFSFYYQANRMALEDAGAEIVEFSPIADGDLPDADLLYIGGGYPELYRQQLHSNIPMRTAVRRFIESGKRFYAECGGLMYLAESIGGLDMVGVVPARIEMTDRLVDFGYCEVVTNAASILGPAGTMARGHQFHYSRNTSASGDAYQITQGKRRYSEGYILNNGLASYVHLHFLSNPALAQNMLNS